MARLHDQSETLPPAPPSPEDRDRDAAIERRTQEIGAELLASVRRHASGPLSARFWSDRLVDWAMRNPAFKAGLFRFVDVFPMLHTLRQVYDCLTEYLAQPGVTVPSAVEWAVKAGGLAKAVFAKTVAGRIRAMAANFIAGADAPEALAVLEKKWREGIAFSVDLLGEACLSEAEADVYQSHYLELIDTLAGATRDWPPRATLENDHLGAVPRTNVSIKISALTSRLDPADFEGTVRRLFHRLRPVLEAAERRGVFVNFDMEQHAAKDVTLELFRRCAEAFDFPAGVAIQAYLTSGEDDARQIIAWTQKTGRQVTVRLIKGAYWDYEVILAEQLGWPVPVWTQKAQTDACFERMTDLLLAATPRRADEGGVKLALGSHNVRSIAHALALLEQHGLPESAVELQMLFGMADPLRVAVRDRGLRLRQYVPVGEMIPGMAYLVRRLLENTSNESWLRAGFHDNVADEELLKSPESRVESREKTVDAEVSQLSPLDSRPFSNEPRRDFSREESRERFAKAVRDVVVPAEKGTVPFSLIRKLGQFPAHASDAEEAVERAAEAFHAWRDRDPGERSKMLIAAAAAMRSRRDELAGIMVRESGKTWREADADVCEAIDFCEFYAREAVALFRPRQLGRFVGELNQLWYEPRGVAVVISPWNFPLAICTGMTAAALVTGNPAIVKPSTETPGVARRMCEALWLSGVPRDVLQFLPGSGSVVGSSLVRHRQVAMVAFTGSKEVGLEILRTAGEVSDGQQAIKKVVCEMGGKNAILVDDTADLDEAVAAVRDSAFGYSGQKCSACSRAIVVDGVHDLFLRRLIEATRSLVIGDPTDPGTDVGPVINAAAAEKIRGYIEIGNEEGRLELACDVPGGLEARVGKPYIGPHIFSDILPEHRLANEEIFGPVLSVMRVEDFRAGLDVANATAYKLTGGVFSRRPSHLAAARRDFRVGNLYLNRGITGALVARQPFGGFGLSGTGTKAGGADYLRHFVQPRSSTENTMRHGFAPDWL